MSEEDLTKTWGTIFDTPALEKLNKFIEKCVQEKGIKFEPASLSIGIFPVIKIIFPTEESKKFFDKEFPREAKKGTYNFIV